MDWPQGQEWKCSRTYLFLQEIAHPFLNELRNYKTYTNVRTAMRGTALVTREETTITNITKLPSGRGTAAEFRGIWMINIYAQSGAAKKKEREQFFDTELACLRRASPTNMILGGDFNCILHKKDNTGYLNYSRALEELVHTDLNYGTCVKPTRQRRFTHIIPLWEQQEWTGYIRRRS
jgi:exonuclease III